MVLAEDRVISLRVELSRLRHAVPTQKANVPVSAYKHLPNIKTNAQKFILTNCWLTCRIPTERPQVNPASLATQRLVSEEANSLAQQAELYNVFDHLPKIQTLIGTTFFDKEVSFLRYCNVSPLYLPSVSQFKKNHNDQRAKFVNETKEAMPRVLSNINNDAWSSPSLRQNDPDLIHLRGSGQIMYAPFIFSGKEMTVDQAFKASAPPLASFVL